MALRSALRHLQHDSLHRAPDDWRVEVDQQPQSQTARAQVRDDLELVDVLKLGDGLELGYRGISCCTQVPLTARFKGDAVGEFYADMIVCDAVVVELKSVAKLRHIHKLQLISYLRASGLRLGLLINFNAPVLWRAVQRVVL